MNLHPDIAAVLEGRAQYAVITGDCLSVLPTLPVGCVDAVVTDPPYGLAFPYLSYTDTPDNLATLIAGFVPESRRIARRVVVFPGVHNLWNYPRADWICSWSWRSTSHFGRAGYSMWQPVLLYGPDADGFGNVGGVIKADSFHFPDGNGIGFLGEDRADHPCPKPELVMKHVVQRFVERDGICLDPFTGSGTTGVACIQTGRRFIGIELEEKYAAIARRRIADAAPLFVPPPAPAPAELFGGGA